MPTLRANPSSGTTVTSVAPSVRWAPPASSHRLAPTPSELVHETVLSEAATQTSSAGSTNTVADPAAARAPATRLRRCTAEPGPSPVDEVPALSSSITVIAAPSSPTPQPDPACNAEAGREMSERAATQPRASASAAV